MTGSARSRRARSAGRTQECASTAPSADVRLRGLSRRAGSRAPTAPHAQVLQCDPRAIRKASIESIVQAADAVDALESIALPLIVRNNLDKVAFVLLAGFIGKRVLIDCAGASCGS